MTQRNNRRRYPLVRPRHQYRFLALVLIYSMLIAVVIAVTLFVPDLMQMQDESLSLEIRALAADKILTLHSRVWLMTISLICVIGLHSFREFHRLIGPVYRFEKAFEQIQNGDLTFRVKLRKNDYLQNEQAELNKMIETLSGKLRHVQSAGGKALTVLDRLEKSAVSQQDRQAADRGPFAGLRGHLETLMEAASYFKSQETEENP